MRDFRDFHAHSVVRDMPDGAFGFKRGYRVVQRKFQDRARRLRFFRADEHPAQADYRHSAFELWAAAVAMNPHRVAGRDQNALLPP